MARRVFVSHIHEEAEVAKVISGWITDAFKGHGVTAFVSSDRQHLPPGRKWRDVVLQNLEGCEVLVAVLSPISLQRPWPNIELGAGWIRGIPVIPFCHSGVRADQLNPPFGDFQGVNAEDDASGRELLGGVADALKADHPEKLHFAQFRTEVLAAAGTVKRERGAEPTVAQPVQPEISEEQVRILQFLAQVANTGHDDGAPLDMVADGAKVSRARLMYHVSKLEDRAFVHVLHWSGDPLMTLLADGAGWLIEHGLMPE